MKTRYFCTLFDSHYLSRGLTMYYSLLKNMQNFHLYIFPFDEDCFNALKTLNLQQVTLISLQDFEDKELLLAKSNRNRVEYCWTCTPSTVLYCIEKFKLDQCTYLDADLFFFATPEPLFEEMGDNSVLITEHRFAPQYAHYVENGIYNVQFVSFKNNSYGLTVLGWWRDRCNEWCYARLEDGKLGDQKYLDVWPQKFEKVHVLKHLGGGIGPWNVQQYRFKKTWGGLALIHNQTNEEYPAIFFHFHNFKIFQNGYAKFIFYKLSENIITFIYKPYLKELIKNTLSINKMAPALIDKGFVLAEEDANYILSCLARKDFDSDNFVIYDRGKFNKLLKFKGLSFGARLNSKLLELRTRFLTLFKRLFSN